MLLHSPMLCISFICGLVGFAHSEQRAKPVAPGKPLLTVLVRRIRTGLWGHWPL
jgi:hypothetical protein